MIHLGILINLGVLWFLITFFTGSTNSDQSLRETIIVIFGVGIVQMVCGLALPGGFELLSIPVSLGALYFLVGWSCETDRRTTIKICAWYMLVALLTSFVGG